MICSSVNCTGFCSAWGPCICMGMRPVPTWKSTDAAPTPIRLGPSAVPEASSPWQVAQFAWKSFLPSSMVACEVGAASAWAVVVLKAA
ncbi:hypothetical protein GCM10025870_02260 [Agromyces marinus]|uniref:Secreted protein n=1 Tax=Agromyces marinus TaxID=1389020 RepID=A0ABN6YCV1_9MICO|nr:hypothetical protein GCM10025870_02260 [Agromyces marinus]